MIFRIKVNGKYVYMQQVRVPGMLHGRVVRPRGQTAYGSAPKVLNIDEKSISGIPARVVRRGDFVGVVADREWDAVRAAQQLKVTWDIKPSLPGNSRMYEQMRSETTQDRVVQEKGNVEAALAAAPHVVKQIGKGPYQAHAAFSPNCAIADVRLRFGAGHFDHPGHLRHSRRSCADRRIAG
jgi:nicotinate dehydrogenase subunit B